MSRRHEIPLFRIVCTGRGSHTPRLLWRSKSLEAFRKFLDGDGRGVSAWQPDPDQEHSHLWKLTNRQHAVLRTEMDEVRGLTVQCPDCGKNYEWTLERLIAGLDGMAAHGLSRIDAAML